VLFHRLAARLAACQGTWIGQLTLWCLIQIQTNLITSSTSFVDTKMRSQVDREAAHPFPSQDIHTVLNEGWQSLLRVSSSGKQAVN
jgi:hypothetical protein